MVIGDNGTNRRRKEMKAFLWEHRGRLEARQFAPYAPGQDPVEQVWTVMKHQRLANGCPTTGEKIRAGVRRELGWMPAHPKLVASLIRRSELLLPPIR